MDSKGLALESATSCCLPPGRLARCRRHPWRLILAIARRSLVSSPSSGPHNKNGDPPAAISVVPEKGLGLRSRTSCPLPPTRLGGSRRILRRGAPGVRAASSFQLLSRAQKSSSRELLFHLCARERTCPPVGNLLLPPSGPPRSLSPPSMAADPRYRSALARFKSFLRSPQQKWRPAGRHFRCARERT